MIQTKQLETEVIENQSLSKQALDWWRGAVIYQVYPRSFCDSNGDGVGDIRGIINKLDYVQDLGVDAIWISPFFKSPMKDFGYDISDYRDVDPLFGCLDDFDDLILEARKRGLKIMIDQVLSHTSDQHHWFEESRRSRDNPKADWYVWADAKDDGSVPNNWISIFGGSAWQWDETREQYYLHNFLTSQPDLNFHCDDLRAQILDEIEFWLKRGVDGFRLDAINFCYHDKHLRDNPFKPHDERTGRGFSPDNPYATQYHLYDNTQDENLAFLESIRQLMNRYPGAITLGEINSEDSLKTVSEYTRSNTRLNMGYNFELLADEFSSEHIRKTVESLESVIGSGWPCWAIGNHDVERVVSRWGNGEHNEQFAKMTLSLAASLRGTLCVYQGEELGLPQAQIEKHQLKDPFGIQFWPDFKGRDGCRTPIAWNSQTPFAGFSCSSSWLPVAPEHIELNVEQQSKKPTSVLNYYRSFLSWRREQPALLGGSVKFLDAPTGLLILEREINKQKIVACFNLTNDTQIWRTEKHLKPIERFLQKVSLANSAMEFGPYGFAYLEHFSND